YEMYGKADNAYHIAILEESGNRYLLKAYHLSAAALEALRVRLQKGGFREQSFAEHVEMARLLRAGKLGDAEKLMRLHILVINDSLASLPLAPAKGARREPSAGRNYAEVFGRSTGREAKTAREKPNRTAASKGRPRPAAG